MRNITGHFKWDITQTTVQCVTLNIVESGSTGIQVKSFNLFHLEETGEGCEDPEECLSGGSAPSVSPTSSSLSSHPCNPLVSLSLVPNSFTYWRFTTFSPLPLTSQMSCFALFTFLYDGLNIYFIM